MARVTIEDCVHYVENRFELVLVAAQRGKELNYGALPTIPDVKMKKEKDAVIALKEIGAGKLSVEALKNSIIKRLITENDGAIDIKKKDINEIEQEVVEDIKSLEKDVSAISKEKQMYQDEEILNV